MNLAPFTLNRSLQDHEVYDRIYMQRSPFKDRYLEFDIFHDRNDWIKSRN